MTNEAKESRGNAAVLAQRLKKARTDSGLTQTELATQADWGDNGKTKVSKIESGKQLPSPEDLTRWAKITGLSSRLADQLAAMLIEAEHLRNTYRKRMGNGQESIQDEYTKLSEKSTHFRFFEIAVFPRYVQVPEYSRAVLQEFCSQSPIDDVDASVAKRQASTQLLYDTTKKFEFLIVDTVLTSKRFPPEIMRPQLSRLMSVIGLSNVRLGIYPTQTRPTRRLPLNMFELLDDIGLIETNVSDGPPVLADVVEQLDRDLADMWKDALEGDEARAVILDALAALPAS